MLLRLQKKLPKQISFGLYFIFIFVVFYTSGELILAHLLRYSGFEVKYHIFTR